MTEEERLSWVRQCKEQTERAKKLGAVVTGAVWKDGKLSVVMVVPPKGCKTQPVPEPRVSRGLATVERRKPPKPTQGRLL